MFGHSGAQLVYGKFPGVYFWQAALRLWCCISLLINDKFGVFRWLARAVSLNSSSNCGTIGHDVSCFKWRQG